ncbi:endonuclease/exonuclease/phosphatase [Streptomyces sp. LP05-1]|uniref:Endonuclease/exonuclease/phosphatase n=1 Tax=Streptomyces pyxinae TaxID=2970734 RepID=A0ABT2CBF7_9ACTN|nr:endonuclease/exonuclease/phosphatase family protein [Streptomyces sp. LP05-1]MCS0634724.1 endonuclease/exonuclease/phosphatase [Streptomyces sp. LP05-1]
MTSAGTLGVLTFNLNNPSRGQAERQLAYLAARPEQILVLTETADSAGCALLERRFTDAGYSVAFPGPEPRGERGVMIVSRLATRPSPSGVNYLPHRAVAVTADTTTGPLEVFGIYVPSRDATPAKITRKQTFLTDLAAALHGGDDRARLLIGDFNLLEPDHSPRYRFFQPWEYAFYTGLGAQGYVDAFRTAHPQARAYSWVGKTGDGYRYDHAHLSGRLTDRLLGAAYAHEPRTMPERLTDHSALSVELTLTPARTLAVVPPARTEQQPAPALF